MMRKGILAVIIIIIIVSGFGCTKEMKAAMEREIQIKDARNVKDGTYRGHYDASLVVVTVEVTVKDQKISDIRLIKHDCGKGKPAEAIIGSIIEEQTLDVDAVTGATASSQVIKLAIEDALNKGMD